jgi:hypothetical protein
MYEYIVAACIVFSSGGDAVNPCFVSKAEGSFATYDQCAYTAKRRKYEVFNALKKKHPNAGILVDAPCGK